MDPMILVQYGGIGIAVMVIYKGLDFAKELLHMKMRNGKDDTKNYKMSPRISYDEQASRLILDVSKTLSEVAINQERQLEISGRTLTSIESMATVLSDHARQTDEWIRYHGKTNG